MFRNRCPEDDRAVAGRVYIYMGIYLPYAQLEAATLTLPHTPIGTMRSIIALALIASTACAHPFE